MSEETQNGQVEEVQTSTPEGEEQQPVAMPATEEPSNELPEDASERTRKEFEKLKEHNKKLAEELEAVKGGQQRPPSLLENYVLHQQPAPAPQVQPIVAPNLSQTQVTEIQKQLIDEQGYLNQDELEARLKLAEQAELRARQAEERANQALERVGRFEVDAQTRALYAKHPQLDPSSQDFDPEFYELTKNELLSQLVNGGKQDPISAADKMSKYVQKKQVSQAQQETLVQRQQATARTGSGNANPSSVNFEELRKRSLTSTEAMDERIRRAGI